MNFPGLIVAAAASHSGKTTVSIGLIAALKARGLRVAAAKCGPDYIDPRFLEAASGGPAINLDPWAMSPHAIEGRLARIAENADLILVEGVMGLFDGGTGGIGSTASLAAMTGLPVVLVVGAGGLAQTAAAVAEGCARLAQEFSIAGAIVNQVASERHAALIREGFSRTSIPLLGLVRREPGIALASRHLGLVQAGEHADLAGKIARAGELVVEGCDLDAIVTAARSLPPCGGELERGEGRRRGLPLSPLPDPPPQGGREGLPPLGQRIAVARDVAFAFAYPHLLQDWREAGAEISFFSPLADESPRADTDAVFLPGGYPELHAAELAAAEKFRAGMHKAATRGALIYGECGGYMVLGEKLVDAEGRAHRMLGLLPVSTSFEKRKLHLGYRRLTPIGGLPWRVTLSAHEFHYATILEEGEGDRLFDAVAPGGEALGSIGLRRDNVMGSFAHVIDEASRL
jgi:cobyrinic acid a,c-diamide synthase